MEYLPLPKHNDPDLDKYDLDEIIKINFLLAKIELFEVKRKIRWLKITSVALLIALAMAVGGGWAFYSTKQASKGWQVNEIYFSFLAGKTYSAAKNTTSPIPTKIK